MGEDVAEVVVDGAGTEEQVRGDLPVGLALGHEPDDFPLLGGEGRDNIRLGLLVVSPAARSSTLARTCQGPASS